MKTVVRSVLMLAIAVWVGALTFFPVVAQLAFGAPISRQAAGSIVGGALITLHRMGLASGCVMLLLVAIVQMRRIFRRPLYPAMILLVVMLGLTVASQFAIIPRMDAYRIAAGGNISLAPAADPNRVGFDRLHQASVRMESGVLLAGVLLVVALAWVDTGESIERR